MSVPAATPLFCWAEDPAASRLFVWHAEPVKLRARGGGGGPVYHIPRAFRQSVLLEPSEHGVHSRVARLCGLPPRVAIAWEHQEDGQWVVQTAPTGTNGGVRYVHLPSMNEATAYIIKWYRRVFAMLDTGEIRSALRGEVI